MNLLPASLYLLVNVNFVSVMQVVDGLFSSKRGNLSSLVLTTGLIVQLMAPLAICTKQKKLYLINVNFHILLLKANTLLNSHTV